MTRCDNCNQTGGSVLLRPDHGYLCRDCFDATIGAFQPTDD